MNSKTAYVLLQDGYADWEPASALAELRRSFGFSIRAMGLKPGTVSSMGGLQVITDIGLSEFAPESAAMLILPGGEVWMKGEAPEISEAVRRMIGAGRPVAAICAAALALAHAGLLDDRLHTSNGRSFIPQYVPKYRGGKHYRQTPAVTDKLVITANGLAPFAFAAEIFRTMAPERKQDIETYQKLYSRGLLD